MKHVKCGRTRTVYVVRGGGMLKPSDEFRSHALPRFHSYHVVLDEGILVDEYDIPQNLRFPSQELAVIAEQDNESVTSPEVDPDCTEPESPTSVDPVDAVDLVDGDVDPELVEQREPSSLEAEQGRLWGLTNRRTKKLYSDHFQTPFVQKSVSMQYYVRPAEYERMSDLPRYMLYTNRICRTVSSSGKAV